MRKIYFSALFLGAFTFATQAQVSQTEDFESYNLGYISPQSDLWKTWSGEEEGEEDAVVSAVMARSGGNSLLVEKNGEGNDQLYLIDDQPDEDIYTVRMYFYIPEGHEAYFNFQGEIFGNNQNNGSFLTGDHYFNPENMTPGQGQTGGNDPVVWFFPHDEWFPVEVVVDMDSKTYDMYVDGTQYLFGASFSNVNVPYLGAVDFYAPSEFTKFYVDDIVTAYGTLSVADNHFSQLSVYPNPMQDQLNISSKSIVDEVSVYDISGRLVMKANPNSTSPILDTASLPSGMYLVKITIEGNSKTVKILK